MFRALIAPCHWIMMGIMICHNDDDNDDTLLLKRISLLDMDVSHRQEMMMHQPLLARTKMDYVGAKCFPRAMAINDSSSKGEPFTRLMTMINDDDQN